MSRRLPAVASALVALAVAVGLAASASAQGPRAPDPSGASAAILIDADDGSVMFEKNPDARRSIASTTKLMTALLTLERARPDAVFTAADYDAQPVESQIGLARGERMRVDDLLEALLLESANDAAVTLAEGVAGSRAAFVRAMNERAAELGLTGTSYANPIGLDQPGNYSTARDLARLTRVLLRNERFARTVDMPSAVLESGARRRVVDNRDELIRSHPFVDGVKTGHTTKAGYVLVGSATGRAGGRVISVVLGEPSEEDRNAETLALLRHGVGQFRRLRPLRTGRPVASAAVEYYDDKRVELVPARNVTVVARRDQRVTTRIDAPEELRGELDAGTAVGRVAVLRDGEVVRRVRLVTAEAVPGAGPLRRIVSSLGIGLTLVVLLVMVSGTAVVGMRVRRRRRARDQEARRRSRAQAQEREPVGKP